MAFEDYSAIESFRIQYHGEAFLRLLSRKEGTRDYELLAEITNGFFIGQDRPTDEAKLQDILTIDFRYSPLVDANFILRNMIAIDLVYPDATFQRYSIASNTTPTFSRDVYSQTINANFGDRNAITGVVVPVPSNPPPVSISFADLLVSNETPAGLIDGSNATFTTAFHFIPESVEVMVNGLYQKRIRDFNTTGNHTIILAISPGAGETLLVNYIKG